MKYNLYICFECKQLQDEEEFSVHTYSQGLEEMCCNTCHYSNYQHLAEYLQDLEKDIYYLFNKALI